MKHKQNKNPSNKQNNSVVKAIYKFWKFCRDGPKILCKGNHKKPNRERTMLLVIVYTPHYD